MGEWVGEWVGVRTDELCRWANGCVGTWVDGKIKICIAAECQGASVDECVRE